MGSEGWNIAESRGVRGGIYFSRVELEEVQKVRRARNSNYCLLVKANDKEER